MFGTSAPPTDWQAARNMNWYDGVLCIASETIPADSLVAITGLSGVTPTVHLATSATLSRSDAVIKYSPNRIPLGASGRIHAYYVITADTSARALGDKAYLTTAGDIVFTPVAGVGAIVTVGYVLTVAVSGRIILDLDNRSVAVVGAGTNFGAQPILFELVVPNSGTDTWTAQQPLRIINAWTISGGGGGTVTLDNGASSVFGALSIGAGVTRTDATSLGNRDVAAGAIVTATANGTGACTMYVACIPR